MGSDVSTKIIIYSSVDGRVRLTTKQGVTFDARLLRWEYGPKRVAVIQPIGFAVSFGEFVPEVLRVAMNQLVEAGRVEEPAAAPDVEKLRKAVEWPIELAPKTTAAAVKRAEAALAAAATGDEARAAVQAAIEAGATKGLAVAVQRLGGEARKELALAATEAGAGEVLAALLPGAEVDRDWLLVRAAAKGKLHSVATLLTAGANVHAAAALEPGAQYSAGEVRSVLHHAVAHGHRSVVRRLLAAGARVTDSAALTWAVVGAPDEVTFELLIAAGLDVNARDRHGDPLLLALGRDRQHAMLAAAIAAGADVNASYPDGSTLLLHAIALAMQKDNSTSFIQDLLRAGADANAGRLNGRNPLALARVVPHDPGANRGERWIAGWLEEAGAVAVEDADAVAVAPEKPPEKPAWQARIDQTLARTGHYEVAGIRFTPQPGGVRAEMTQVRGPAWGGLGSDTIAVVRAKLEHLVGPPHDRGDEYKSTFEYWFAGTVDGTSLALRVCDWKAHEVAVTLEVHPDAALRERVAAGFRELLTISPLAPFRDRFRYDDEAGRVYRSDGRTALAELAKSR
ncbi:Ankyrin repeat-containing protein [Nannocystis exedens]|uniref:Ankyrin repeat-containing protein n=1 Tax=Nannocystis exedens TaxID=54 RepID=A0A1I2DT95_9BACT|nr:ankyrin repeat domain-containing protein [Nannocystis exedens]PCC68911.1 Ankyrin repeats (3 copies) [Nannocystis exedens]SFE83785.1 Ankyrin repeat-containing protein [Nannocystis exedens]